MSDMWRLSCKKHSREQRSSGNVDPHLSTTSASIIDPVKITERARISVFCFTLSLKVAICNRVFPGYPSPNNKVSHAKGSLQLI